MRPLALDFQRPPPGLRWVGWLLLSAGLLLSGLFLAQSLFVAEVLVSTEQQVSRLKREAERRGVPATADEQGDQRRSSASAARWESLLHALEMAGDDSVTLLGIEPGAQEIAVTGEARNIDATLDYVARLQRATVFADAHLVRHELVKDNPYRPVRFTLLARWREAPR